MEPMLPTLAALNTNYVYNFTRHGALYLLKLILNLKILIIATENKKSLKNSPSLCLTMEMMNSRHICRVLTP